MYYANNRFDTRLGYSILLAMIAVPAIAEQWCILADATVASTAIEASSVEKEAAVKAAYQVLVAHADDLEAYRTAFRTASGYTADQGHKRSGVSPAIAVNGLIAVTELDNDTLRQERTIDWCILTKLTYAKNERVEVVKAYILRTEKIECMLWSTLVSLFGQDVDEVLFGASDRIEIFDQDAMSQFRMTLRKTDIRQLSPKARSAYVKKYRAVQKKTEATGTKMALAQETLICAALLDGAEASSALRSLQSQLTSLQYSKTHENTQRIDSDASYMAKSLVDMWADELHGNKKIRRVLGHYIDDARLNKTTRP